MVNQFAIENLDDQTETYQKAFDAFTKGNIDSALAILDKVDLEKRLEKNAEQIAKAKTAIDALDKNIASKQEQMKQDVEQALLDARMHKLKYQFAETEASYDLVLKYDSINFGYAKEYYNFLNDTKNYKKAVSFLEKTFQVFKNLDQNNSLNKWHTTLIQMLLGFSYFSGEDLLNAEKVYNECLINEDQLAKTDPEFYQPKIAGQKFLLALVYEEQNDYSKAENLFKEVLRIQKKLALTDQDYNEPDVINTESSLAYFYAQCKDDIIKADSFYNDALQRSKIYGKFDTEVECLLKTDMGDFYKENKNFTKAEIFYKEAFELIKSEKNNDSLTMEKGLSNIENKLGDLYFDTENYVSAENYYLQALKIYNNLMISNASGFENDVADTKLSLGVLYDKMKNYEKAEYYYKQSLENYKHLSLSNPKKYEPGVARTENNLGIVYENKKDYKSSEAHYLLALVIRQELATTDSTIQASVAETKRNLGILYYKEKDYEKSDTFYQQSLKIYEQLAEKNPKEYKTSFAKTLNDLGLLYEKKKDFKKAETFYQDALAIRQDLAKTGSAAEGDVANTKSDLGILYYNLKDYYKSETLYLESLTLYKRLSEKDPKNFKPEIARTYNNLGSLYKDEVELSKAETCFLNSLNLYEQLSLQDSFTYKEKVFDIKADLMDFYFDAIDTIKNEIFERKYDSLVTAFYNEMYKRSLTENLISNDDAEIWGDFSWHLLFVKKFKEAEDASHAGLQIDSSKLWIETNLAHALLFQNNYEAAAKEYLYLKNKKSDSNRFFKDIFFEDFDTLEKHGITHPDIIRIKALLKKD